MINGNATLAGCKFDIVGNDNRVVIEDFVFLKNVIIYIRGNDNRILISNKVKFRRGGEIWIEDDNCEVTIGERSTFEEAHIAVTEPNSKVVIGKDCMFAYGIDVRTGDSHSIVDKTSGARINYAANINIGDHVWVAAHVSILKGSEISANSVVATRSVVTKQFPLKNVILAGIPARVIKENVDWTRERIYDK